MKFMTLTLTLMIVLQASVSEASDFAVVQLKNHVVMKTENLKLKDILDDTGTDIEFMAKHGDVVVLNGDESTETISRSDLYAILMKEGIDLDSVSIKMDHSVSVERGQTIELNDGAKKKLLDALTKSYGIPPSDIKIESVKILPKIPDTKDSATFFTGIDVLDVSKTSNAKFVATVENADGIESEHNLFVRLTVETSVAQLKEDMQSGASINEESVVYGRKKLETLTDKLFVKSMSQGKSFKLINSVRKDGVLMASDVAESILVAEGSLVTITFRGSGLNISTLGKLQTSGEIGQLVKVENVDSQRIVSGILISSDEVEVAHD